VQHVGGAPADSTGIQVPEDETSITEPGMFGPTPSQGFFLRHMKNLEVSHVEVQPVAADPRASFYLEDVHRADFIGGYGPSTPPAFSISNSSDVRIRLSRAAADSTTP